MLSNAIPLSLAPVLAAPHMGQLVKTGKGPVADHPHASPRHESGALKFARLVGSTLNPKPVVNWHQFVKGGWGMYLNDEYGDCTCATMGHATKAWSAARGKQISPSDASILAAYRAVSGYNGDPSTDRGAIELQVLNWWRNTGLSDGSQVYKIDAFIALEPQNHDHIKLAIELFGGIYTGVALPMTAQNQPIWHPALGGREQGGNNNDAKPGSWGGHARYYGRYDDFKNRLYSVTWGEEKEETWSYWDAYVDEAYACLSTLWCPVGGYAPSGVSYDQLRTYLGELVG